MSDASGFYLTDPEGTIEREIEQGLKQGEVALTYALAIRGEPLVPVNWSRVNAAITKRWPKGLMRVKKAAWKKLRTE